MMEVNGFRDLKVWQSGKELVLEVYKLTAAFPKEELYGITSQMRRASVSIPANIAEGFNRYYSKDYKRFLYFALGSCAELVLCPYSIDRFSVLVVFQGAVCRQWPLPCQAPQRGGGTPQGRPEGWPVSVHGGVTALAKGMAIRGERRLALNADRPTEPINTIWTEH